MTTFWRPVAPSRVSDEGYARTKQLGGGLYVLWARCDACQRSDAFERMTLWERGSDVGTLCICCNARAEITRELRADGWVFLG